MLFISVEDFLTQADAIPRLSREEQKALADKMAAGDRSAREALVRSHLPFVASYVRRSPQEIRTLRTVYAYISALEKAVDRFHFQQSSEPFVHHLSWALRQCMTRCIADRR